MILSDSASAKSVDLTTCDREPIHIPSSIQPHGTLLVFNEPEQVVVQAAENAAEFLGLSSLDQVLGKQLDDLFPSRDAHIIEAGLGDTSLEGNPLQIGRVSIQVGTELRTLYAIAHRMRGVLILELEVASVDDRSSFQGVYSMIQSFVLKMQRTTKVEQLHQLAAAEIRRMTGFDRTLIYQFDEEWNGTVVGEDRNGVLPSYLGLRFPASDIPAQARELYRLNRVRLIADAGYRPVPIVPAINPQTQQELDMTWSLLRSVSPIHVEYMKNMGTGSSMSISILRDGRLWGLISCHSSAARRVPYDVRTACDLLAQVFAVQLTAKEHHADYEYRIKLKDVQTRLLAILAAEDTLLEGLKKCERELLELTSARGAAVIIDGECVLLGKTPTHNEVTALTEWLVEHGRGDVFHTDTLASIYPPASSFADVASGILAISISKLYRSHIVWFRPEVVQTVEWGGDPNKSVTADSDSLRLHPRKSFELWRETVRDQAIPWRPSEVQAAEEFRHDILGIVLRKAEELAELSDELKRSNRELEAFSYSVSHDLRAPFRHIVGYSELLREQAGDKLDNTCQRYISTIIESATFAGTLVDNLLSFSQVGRTALNVTAIDMNALVQEIIDEYSLHVQDRNIRWEIGQLPHAQGDLLMFRMALTNLIGNAIKYTRHIAEAVIEIGSYKENRATVYYIRDNGIGFDMRYVSKLFGVFQRLHKMEDFEGSGIGLANVRRIVERHNGRVWAEGSVGEGAAFYFSLPDVDS